MAEPSLDMAELYEDCVVSNNALLIPSNNRGGYNGMHVKISHIVDLVCPRVARVERGDQTFKLGVRFVIPKGLYVDMYELRRRHDWNVRSNKISIGAIKIMNYTYNSTMNGEIIAEHFNQSTELFIEFGVTPVDYQFNIQYLVPMHLRYHLPSYRDSHEQVFLSSPEVFINDVNTCQSGIGNRVVLTIPIGNMNDLVYVYSLSVVYYVSSVLIVLYVVCKSL